MVARMMRKSTPSHSSRPFGFLQLVAVDIGARRPPKPRACLATGAVRISSPQTSLGKQ